MMRNKELNLSYKNKEWVYVLWDKFNFNVIIYTIDELSKAFITHIKDNI